MRTSLFLLFGSVCGIKVMEAPRTHAMNLENRCFLLRVTKHRHPDGNHEAIAELVCRGFCRFVLVTDRKVERSREDRYALHCRMRVNADFQVRWKHEPHGERRSRFQ